MQRPVLDVPFSTTLGGDYIEEPFDFFVGSTTRPDAFTGCSVIGGIYVGGAKRVDLGSATTGYASITQPNRVIIAVPKADMEPLGVINATVQLWLVTPLGQTQELIAYALQQGQP